MRSSNWNRCDGEEGEKIDENCLDNSTIEVSLSTEDEQEEEIKEKKLFKKYFDKDQHIDNVCISSAIVFCIIGAIIYLPLFLIMMAGLTVKEFYDKARNY
ncbi:hypothetical protein P5Y60_004345 [Salmonella enterica]|nr:hypothetical protein [Salmonella enterica]